MRVGYLAVAVTVVMVSTSAFAKEGSGRRRGGSSGHSNSGGATVEHHGSSARSSRSGHTSQYRTPTHYSSNRGATSGYRTGGGRRYYRNSHSSSYRYRPYRGYRSYYRPGFSLYLGAPLYYDSYYYGGYYPEAYATAPYGTAPYASAPYATDDGYRAPAEEDEDAMPQADDRDIDGAADTAGSSRLPLDVRPADATIYVDGQFRGTAASDALLLTPGRHTVEVARPGYRSERRVVDVGSGEGRPLSITLQPAPR